LQAPTSVAFLGMVAVTLFPRAPRPRPPLPPFSLRPPRPAWAARAIFFDLRGLTDSWEMALVLVALAFLRQALVRAELFVPPSSLAPISRPVPWGAIPCQSDTLWSDSTRISDGSPAPWFRWLHVKRLDGPRWPSLPSLAVLIARLPRWTLSLDFLAPAFPGELVRVLF
jgi:hypothetical protein